jgi:hypothetical protein
MAEHIKSTENLHNYLVLFSSRAWNSLDSKFRHCGDVKVVQQIPQSASGDQGFISGGPDLINVKVCLVLLSVSQRSVVFIVFTFSPVAIFFFFLIVFFFLMIVVVVIILWQLLSFLRVFSYRYHDHDLDGVLSLRNILRRVGLWLLQRWYIPWCLLTSRLTVDVSYAALQAHRIINIALHREYSPGIVFIFSQGRKDLYHV